MRYRFGSYTLDPQLFRLYRGCGDWHGGPAPWVRSCKRELFTPEQRDQDIFGFRVAWPALGAPHERAAAAERVEDGNSA